VKIAPQLISVTRPAILAVALLCAVFASAQSFQSSSSSSSSTSSPGDEIIRPSVPAIPLFSLKAYVSTNPSSAQNPYFGSITDHPATNQTINLSLDEAIRRGFEFNLGLKQAEANEKASRGQRFEAMQLFLPEIHLDGSTGFRQANLATYGFGPSLIAKLGTIFPLPPDISLITHAEVTEGNISFKQTLFSVPIIDIFKASGALEKVEHYSRMTARGEVVQQVATAYLRALATESDLENARALEKADQLLYDHAHQLHSAGVTANLDELRAHVQWQTQQQQVIAAENAHEKSLILLRREIGLAPSQPIALTDPQPYSELTLNTPEELRALAYKNRQDYGNLLSQRDEARAARSGYSHQRWPTLSFKGNYAATAVNGVGTHGNYSAVGTLTVPIFREAQIRGDVDIASAQLSAINAQFDDLTHRIDQQVRSSLLDVQSSEQLVKVARSNLDLATEALSDETDRYNAGIDTNLPLVQAQASLAAAQTNLVQSQLQYNLAKLNLARATGVIELQYRLYLGK